MGIKVGMRRIRMGMRNIRVGMWRIGSGNAWNQSDSFWKSSCLLLWLKSWIARFHHPAQWTSDVLWTFSGRPYERTPYRPPLDVQWTSNAHWELIWAAA